MFRGPHQFPHADEEVNDAGADSDPEATFPQRAGNGGLALQKGQEAGTNDTRQDAAESDFVRMILCSASMNVAAIKPARKAE